ncbi:MULTISPECIES: tlde1 domain-containing protein [unclassified Sinorhizobium]|uniref:DUF2778 domain-containing protein n=1 Tax=unclassified Sinorhizobium TaxID=2613772 RepID=UPI0035244E61
MAFATETFSDVNPLVRFRFRPAATRGVIAGAALVGLGTVAFSWMVATFVTMQTMGMSIGSGSAISSHTAFGAKDIALTNFYEKQLPTGTFFSSALTKGGRVWKSSPIADTGRFAAAPLEHAPSMGTALSVAALVEHFRNTASLHGSRASAKTDRIVAQASAAAEPRERPIVPGVGSSAQSPEGSAVAAGQSTSRLADASSNRPLIPAQASAPPAPVNIASASALPGTSFESHPAPSEVSDKQQTGLLANPTVSINENRSATSAAGPAKRPIAPKNGLPSFGRDAVPVLGSDGSTDLSVASIALPATNPSAPPMHFMPAEVRNAPVVLPAPSAAAQLAAAAPAEVSPEKTSEAIAVPLPTPAPLERSPAPADTGDRPSETELASIEPELDLDLPDDVPLPTTRPRGLPKIITEGPEGQAKPSAGQALAYARPENPLGDDEDDPGPRPLFSPRSRGAAAIYDISAHMVYLPNGERLEAHSGLGGMLDNPRYVNQKNRGPTPPHTYDLVMREKLFHGVAAIRLLPVDASKIYGRDGLLAHTYMLGPRGDSNGCVSFKDYRRFLAAFKRGEIKQLVVVPRLSSPPTRFAFFGRAT